MHLYVEMERSALTTSAVSTQILQEHLSVYFKYMDQDYKDLKRILGLDPLRITVLKCGTFAEYQRRFGAEIRRVNPESSEINDLLQCHEGGGIDRREGKYEWI